jgi:hypothetical protein
MKFLRENIITPLPFGKGYINTLRRIFLLMEMLEVIFVREKFIPNCS